jgi:hypothetical protein
VSRFEESYPALSLWAKTHGWVEVGLIEGGHLTIRVLDEGGMIWESATAHSSIEDALQAAEVSIARWMREQFGPR